MRDDDILNRIKNETAYLADDGFSARVLDALPQPRLYRQKVIGLSWSLALILGLVLCIRGGSTWVLVSFQPALLWSAVTLTFWAMLELFVFVAKDEGILDI